MISYILIIQHGSFLHCLGAQVSESLVLGPNSPNSVGKYVVPAYSSEKGIVMNKQSV